MTRPALPTVGQDRHTWGTALNAVLLDVREDLDYLELGDTSVFADRLQSLERVRYRAPTICALGDSITSNGNNDNGAGPRNWLMHACIASAGKLHWVDSVGGGGYKTAQILTDLLPQVLARDPRPGYCAIHAGANDTGVTSFASWSTDYAAILNALADAGIMAVICPIVPNDTGSKHADAAKFNAWLNWQAKTRGLPYVDWLGDLMDPTTAGSWAAGLEDDGVHPIAAGAKAMGDALWREIAPWIDGQPVWAPPLAYSNSDPHNLHSNGLFLTDSNTDGLADNLSAFEGGAGTFTDYVTPTIEDPDDGDAVGKWQQLARIASPASYAQVYAGGNYGDVSPGDRLALAFRIKTSGVASSGVAIGAIGLFQWPSTTIPAGNVDGADGTVNRWWTNGWAHDIGAMTVYQELTVRSAASSGVRFLLNLGSTADAGTISIAQLTVRNLTDLGIV